MKWGKQDSVDCVCTDEWRGCAGAKRWIFVTVGEFGVLFKNIYFGATRTCAVDRRGPGKMLADDP